MRERRHRITLGYVAAAVVLALVFSMYFSPDLIVDLAGRIWSCF